MAILLNLVKSREMLDAEGYPWDVDGNILFLALFGGSFHVEFLKNKIVEFYEK